MSVPVRSDADTMVDSRRTPVNKTRCQTNCPYGNKKKLTDPGAHELVEVLRQDLLRRLVRGSEIARVYELGARRGGDGHEHVLLHGGWITEEHVVARSFNLDPVLRAEELVPVDGVVERAETGGRARERGDGLGGCGEGGRHERDARAQRATAQDHRLRWLAFIGTRR